MVKHFVRYQRWKQGKDKLNKNSKNFPHLGKESPRNAQRVYLGVVFEPDNYKNKIRVPTLIPPRSKRLQHLSPVQLTQPEWPRPCLSSLCAAGEGLPMLFGEGETQVCGSLGPTPC
jgi:hypothetical protein